MNHEGRRTQQPRNEAEAVYEVKEELKRAYKAGKRAAQSERDMELLRQFLQPSQVISTIRI